MTTRYPKLVSSVRTMATILGCLCALLALQTAHNHLKSFAPAAHFPWTRTNSNSATTTPRRLDNVDEDGTGQTPVFDDDVTRDETCRAYIMKFLNGTTDAKDNCQGMLNAFTAGDCQDDSSIHHPIFGATNQEGDGEGDDGKNSSDVLIDDDIEAWECCDHISNYYTKHCEQEELDATRLFGIVAVLIACWLAKSLLRVNGWQWIPDAGACILVGALVGGILRLITSKQEIDEKLSFNNNLFLQVMLPPIIFEAALSIDKRAFRRDLFPILTFAVLGTGFSALAIGYITYLGSGKALPMLESLSFGALMSSIDPVATLSILSGVGVGQGDTLYTLVFGESLLNDGVSIVLFDSLVRHIGDVEVVGQATAGEVLLHFFLVSSGSFLIGVLCGALCTFYFWAMQGKNTAVSEGALFFTWALIPYYIADAFELSGIISIMVMGFMLDYYVIGGFEDERAEWNTLSNMDSDFDNSRHHPTEPFLNRFKSWCDQAFSGKGHMQEHSREHVGYVAEVLSSILETAIFAYLGLFLFNDNEGSFGLTGAGIFACVSSRAVMVVVLSALVNIFVWFDMETKLTNIWRTMRGRGDTVIARQAYESATNKGFLGARTQFILFTAGIRGAVSYALVQDIPVYDAVSGHGSTLKPQLKNMTSATIVGVLFVFGALTYFGVDKNGGGGRTNAAEDGEATLSQLLMDETQQQATSEEERTRAEASFEVDFRQNNLLGSGAGTGGSPHRLA